MPPSEREPVRFLCASDFHAMLAFIFLSAFTSPDDRQLSGIERQTKISEKKTGEISESDPGNK
jgi:hypothetical protein